MITRADRVCKLESVSLVGAESEDILNSGYEDRTDGGGFLDERDGTHPSVDHFCQHQTLLQLGMEDQVDQLNNVSSSEVAIKARRLIKSRMPPGFDIDELGDYLNKCRDAFTRDGLRLRLQQDSAFRQELMATGKNLMIVCDRRDAEFGVGMDREEFVDYCSTNSVDTMSLYNWTVTPEQRPDHCQVGRNKLGLMLMELREEGHAMEKAEKLSKRVFQTAKFTISDQVIALKGVYRTLSNYYVCSVRIKGRRYRSTEHYVYMRALQSLKVDDKQLEKVRTTVDPAKVWLVYERILRHQKQTINANKQTQLNKNLLLWRKKAMKMKLKQHSVLKALLKATGDALLVETSHVDDLEWSVGQDERTLQYLLAKRDVTAQTLHQWIANGRSNDGSLLFGSNLTGEYLMELRARLLRTDNFADEGGRKKKGKNDLLTASETDPMVCKAVTEHLICFTADSAFHPRYKAAFNDHTGRSYATVQHFVAAEAANHFDFSDEDCLYITEQENPDDCFQALEEVITLRSPQCEQLVSWELRESVEATRTALRFRFEQWPTLLRTLLDTGDALLAFCQRFFSETSQWSTGMREKELRDWMRLCDVDTAALAQILRSPASARPCYTGANRLGFLLMELRREFRLKGVDVRSLPALTSVDVDAILGSDSPTENMNSYEPFQPADQLNWLAVWPNPLLLYAKKSGIEALWVAANERKQPPVIRPQQQQQWMDGGAMHATTVVDRGGLDTMEPDAIRLLVMESLQRVRKLTHLTDSRQQELDYLAHEMDVMRIRRQRILNDCEELQNQLVEQGQSAVTVDGGQSQLALPPSGCESVNGVPPPFDTDRVPSGVDLTTDLDTGEPFRITDDSTNTVESSADECF